MADYDRRNNQGPRGGYNNRKRRYRDDYEDDRRPQRRRYEEPLHVKVRKQLLSIAESPLKKADEEISSLAKLIVENFFDLEIQTQFLELSVQLIVEQPLKIPFIAAIVLVINRKKPEVTEEVLKKVGSSLQEELQAGHWREVKLLLRFLGCLQSLLQGDGVFPILGELFDRAVDLQTASSEDSLGLELVKIILITIPYVMASSATGFHEHAVALLDKTDIIASTPHALEALVNPYPGSGNEDVQEPQSAIGLLQRQLQAESEQQWKLACIPRAWDVPKEEPREEEATSEAVSEPAKHDLPQITVPTIVAAGPRPRLPEIYFSVYADQEIETVPTTSDLASSIIRDALVDTINILDYNRNVTAKFLIDVDCYFAPGTFVKRATQFDKLRSVEEGRSTWKPEDVAVDAVFSQLLQLPTPEHKLVYYHSVLTEACKIAPAAIAPSLGRAIRWLYQNVEAMDLELVYRFMDWFSHHLSNFGFTWKWTEWVDDVSLLPVHPKKAFIVGALEKEIRLSFASRIKGTLPEPYRILITENKEEDTPPFKYHDPPVQKTELGEDVVSPPIPYAEPAHELLRLIKSKAPNTEIQAPLTTIQEIATAQGVSDPLVPSTDAYVTAICFLGSKSLSHTLALIERCKDRLLSIGPASEAARRQIITSVMEYWVDKPGVGVNVVDKLLNYTILTPSSVVLWALGPDQLGKGEQLIKAHVYEMVASTVAKVTNRVRQIVLARNARGLPAEQVAMLDDTLLKERAAMSELFKLTEDALVGVADGSVDAMAESRDQDQPAEQMLRGWGKRWLLVFRRRMAVEEAWVLETMAAAAAASAEMEGVEAAVGGATVLGAGDVVFENGHGHHHQQQQQQQQQQKTEAAVVEAVANGESKGREVEVEAEMEEIS